MRWWERVGAWDEAHRFAVDAAVALAAAIVMVPTASDTLDRAGGSVGLYAASLAMVVPLAWRRTAPVASAVVIYTFALGHLLGGTTLLLPADALVLVALYSVTVHGPVWSYRIALAGSLVGSLLAGATIALEDSLRGPQGGFVWSLTLSLGALSTFAFALVRRSRREVIATLVDRARRLEVERDQQAQLATSAERARIAREMHDIVAHSLSVVIAQADGGRYAAAQNPAAAERALDTIAETGRAALADMRRLLGVLRPSAGPSTSEATGERPRPGVLPGVGGRTGPAGDLRSAGRAAPVPDLVPQPAVDDVAGLVAHVRDSGVRVSLVRMGTPRTLPPGTGLTVYRICQESLTNVLKHAGPAPTATVLLQWAAASLVLEVTDDGRGAAAESDGAGQGVLGMRERAAMLGGTLTLGPRPGGGFRVRAEIPIPPLHPSTQETP